MKVYILQLTWRYRGEQDTQIVNVFDDYKFACQELKLEAVNEVLNSWLGDFLDDELELYEGQHLDHYELSEDSFIAESSSYDARTEFFITQHDVL